MTELSDQERATIAKALTNYALELLAETHEFPVRDGGVFKAAKRSEAQVVGELANRIRVGGIEP